MGRVAARAVARGQPPAVRAVSGVASGVADAVLAVDQGVLNVLLPIVRIPVPESARIEPAEGIVREEQRAAEVRRSEEHTSELQSLMRISYAVFCLKKKKNT